MLRRPTLPSLFLLPLLAYGGLTQAEIYRWVNDNGDVEYSDQYREGAEKVKVAPVTTVQMPKPSDIPPPAASAEPEKERAIYQQLSFTFPEAESAFHSGNGNISVMFESKPNLRPGHSYRVRLDGQVAGITEATTLELQNVDRGTHTLVLEVIDSSSLLQSSEPLTFTLHRPTVPNNQIGIPPMPRGQ